MSDIIKLKRGLNIPVAGVAAQQIKQVIVPKTVAVKPTDFRGLVPKVLVHEGDSVMAGSPILADKANPSILFTSPVSGTVAAVVRGEKRKLLEVRILADGKNQYVDFGAKNPSGMKADEIRQALLSSGLWPSIIQRPYGIVADPQAKPKGIFISAFDTAPLANDREFTLKDEMQDIQTGIDALAKMSGAPVHVSCNSDSSAFLKLKNVTFHQFRGPHPAGNPGIQIHHISPINKGETVWTVSPVLLSAIGRFFRTGHYDMSRTVAVTGPAAKAPAYIRTVAGMSLSEISQFCSDPAATRFVSGNVLTGTDVGSEGFLGFFDDQITLLPEGNYHEMFGWAKPFRCKKFSFSRAYFSWLTPKKKYDMDTNLNGGERAFVMSDVYGKVLPMDIYPVYLVKAAIASDIDKMEQLGIYEVLPEDFALCEYVCPSKIEIQSILSDGINLMMKEMA